MKFIMVIIICFGVDCRAIYEEFAYDNYQDCIMEAQGVRDYMKMTFPMSSGQVYCWDDNQFENFREGLQKDGLPTPDNLPTDSISA